MRALAVLTPSESKRLIGKAVAQMDVVKKAFKNGIIIIGRSSTTSFIIEELVGKKINLELSIGGAVVPKGICTNAIKRSELIIKHGKVEKIIKIERRKRLDPKEIRRRVRLALDEMDQDDVYIKGANAIDPDGNAGILLGGLDGGHFGVAVGTIYGKGINLIVPVGLEKMIPTPVGRVVNELGNFRVDRSMGYTVGFFPLIGGQTITEVEAVRILSGADAIPVAAGGINGAEGSIILIIKGEESKVKKMFDILDGIKGEAPIKITPPKCDECSKISCSYHTKFKGFHALEKRYSSRIEYLKKKLSIPV